MVQVAAKPNDLTSAIAGFVQILGDDHVLYDSASLELASVDFSEAAGPTASLLVRPGTPGQLAEAVKLASKLGMPFSVRGGGMSYTMGYAPTEPGVLIVDIRRLNNIVEINLEDAYVTVEAGVTWAQLAKALEPYDMRVAFGGTLSGERATVGGALGNNAAGLGRGEVADDLLGMQIVLANGDVLETGARATGRPVQPMKNYGPDLTGLFVHDAGILGVKTAATFRLTPRPKGVRYLSVGFQDTFDLVNAMNAIAKLNVAAESVAFGSYHNEQFAQEPAPPKESMPAVVQSILATRPSKFRGGLLLAQMALARGTKFLSGWKHSLHLAVEGDTQGSADVAARQIKRICAKRRGRLLPPTLAVMMRAMPFNPVERLIVGAFEENNSFPSNRICRASKVKELVSLIEAFFVEEKDFIEANGLKTTCLYLVNRPGEIGVEPIIYWRDEMNALRLHVVESPRRDALAAIPRNEASRRAALELRKRLIERLNLVEGAHYQIGKFYPYLHDLRSDVERRTLSDLKAYFDPAGALNPGGLGLGGARAALAPFT